MYTEFTARGSLDKPEMVPSVSDYRPHCRKPASNPIPASCRLHTGIKCLRQALIREIYACAAGRQKTAGGGLTFVSGAVWALRYELPRLVKTPAIPTALCRSPDRSWRVLISLD